MAAVSTHAGWPLNSHTSDAPEPAVGDACRGSGTLKPGRLACGARRLELEPAVRHMHECRPLAQLALCFSAATACRVSAPPAGASLIFRAYFARYANTKSKPQAPNVESACNSCRTAASVSLGGHGCAVRTSCTESNRACSVGMQDKGSSGGSHNASSPVARGDWQHNSHTSSGRMNTPGLRQSPG
jgi:hypothetical protein